MILTKGYEKKEAAKRAAMESFVLLKNEKNTLPLKGNNKIKLALFGTGQICTVKGGTGSGDVNNVHSVPVLEGLCAKECYSIDERLATLYRTYVEENHLQVREMGDERPCYPELELAAEEYIRAATDNEAAVVVISRISGEGKDREAIRGDFFLQEKEVLLLQQVRVAFDKVILLLNTGGVISMKEADPLADAILFIGQPGQEGGHAVADVLCGESTPSGKLPDSWADTVEEYPSAVNFGMRDRNDCWNPMGLYGGEERAQCYVKYEEDIFVGYRYFDTFGKVVRYPFGYGLSYAKFFLQEKETSMGQDGLSLRMTVQVKNIGECYSGKEVVQIYVSKPESMLEQPYMELVGFAKTKLLVPGEETEVIIEIPLDRLVSYSEEQHSWILSQGYYDFRMGNSSRDTHIVASARVKEYAVIEVVKKLSMQPRYHFKPICHKGIHSISYSEEEQERKLARDNALIINCDSLKTKAVFYREELPQLCPCSEQHYVWNQVKKGECTVEEFVGQMEPEELAKLACGPGLALFRMQADFIIGDVDGAVPGAAGITANFRDKYGLGSIIMADGPAGLRLRQTVTDKDGQVMMYQNCTAYPVGMLLAASWNTDLLEEIGGNVGQEMKEMGIDLWLAPGMNIHRHPLCGRNFEYFSEDPFLTARCATAITCGVQNYGRGVTIKHFACNSQEDMRANSSSEVSERALREIYLKAFELTVKEGKPLAIMTGYNDINGVPCADSYELCTAIARDEWGFEGFIMTDWGGGLSTPGISMYAGNDLIMPGGDDIYQELLEAMQQEQFISRGAQKLSSPFTLAMIQKSICNMLRTFMRLERIN